MRTRTKGVEPRGREGRKENELNLERAGLALRRPPGFESESISALDRRKHPVLPGSTEEEEVGLKLTAATWRLAESERKDELEPFDLCDFALIRHHAQERQQLEILLGSNVRRISTYLSYSALQSLGRLPSADGRSDVERC